MANPTWLTDPNGREPDDPQKKSLKGAAIWAGKTLKRNEKVRSEYNTKKVLLTERTPENIAKRDQLRSEMRAKTPEPIKSVLDNLRPSGNEASRPKNNPAKGSQLADNLSKGGGYLGKGLLIYGAYESSQTIVNSPDPVKETVTEGAGWVGAIYGGSEGAIAGAEFGPYGSIAGGIGGSVVGFLFGKEAMSSMLSTPDPEPGSPFHGIHKNLTNGNLCFVKGTLIHSKNSLIPIENLEIGDSVCTFNIDKGQLEVKAILNKVDSKTEKVLKICVANEEIYVTETHPFYVVGKGWRLASQLIIGEELYTKKGLAKRIKKIDKMDLPSEVYNLEIEGNNNYFVTDEGFLVHNKNITFIKQLEEGRVKEKNINNQVLEK